MFVGLIGQMLILFGCYRDRVSNIKPRETSGSSGYID